MTTLEGVKPGKLIWIIGRSVELPNGHKYMAEPFIAFSTNKAAQDACDLVEKISGERPMIADAPINDSADCLGISQ